MQQTLQASPPAAPTGPAGASRGDDGTDTADSAATTARQSDLLRRDVARELVAACAGLALGAGVVALLAGLGIHYLLKAGLLGAGAAGLVWRTLSRDPGLHPHPRFGAANRVTLGRAMGVVLLAALLGETGWKVASSAAAAWMLVLAATLCALLDAVDGRLARRSGLASRFGARFDMETDAAFTAVLAALVWSAGQAPAWVLAAGAMRYVFVAAARWWPWLAAPLPPSRRRQFVCVLQITTLIVCLAPIVPPLLAGALAAASVCLLAVSFAVDVHALAGRRGLEPNPRPPLNGDPT